MIHLPYANITIEHWNEGASMPLIMPVQLIANVSDDLIDENVRINSRGPYEWLKEVPPHEGIAVLCGNGPSLVDHIEDIKRLHADGAVIFAMNGAGPLLAARGILPDYQVMLDARLQTADLIGPALTHLFGSQVHPECFKRVPNAKLWHLAMDGLDELLPDEQPEHIVVGGGASVGNSAAALAHALGFKTLHFYGYDSSYRGHVSHARHQVLNDADPTCDVTFNGKVYRCALTMKFQAERFQELARALKQCGCKLYVHGDGLLPDMFNAPQEVLDEAEKYRRMWEIEAYRVNAPGEACVERFLEVAKPSGHIIDFGCGTGRAALKLADAGFPVITLDFVDNCRDPMALGLPFFVHDLRDGPFHIRTAFGFCADVMEHIEPDKVDTVIANIMETARSVFFQISTVPDQMGVLIGQPLHLTVRPFKWWRETFERVGSVEWSDHDAIACQMLVSRKEN